MPTFTYVARARSGSKQRGSLNADSRQAATQLLQQQGLHPEKLVEKKGFTLGGPGPKVRKRVRASDLLVFTRQLSTIVSAGLPLLQGLDILSEQTEDPNFGAVIDAVAQ